MSSLVPRIPRETLFNTIDDTFPLLFLFIKIILDKSFGSVAFLLYRFDILEVHYYTHENSWINRSYVTSHFSRIRLVNYLRPKCLCMTRTSKLYSRVNARDILHPKTVGGGFICQALVRLFFPSMHILLYFWWPRVSLSGSNTDICVSRIGSWLLGGYLLSQFADTPAFSDVILT